MVERLNQVQKEIEEAKNGITVAEDSIKAVEEKLKTAEAKHAEELKKDRDYERAKHLALQQQLTALQQQLTELLKEKNRSESAAAAGLGLGSTAGAGGAADSRPKVESPLATFAKLCGVQLSASQIAALCSHQGAMNAMVAGLLDEKLAKIFFTEIKSRMRSSTKEAIENEKGYIFDGSLGSGGQASRSSMYYVFKDAGVYCGKAYMDDPESMEHEKSVSLAVHAKQAVPTLIKVIDAFQSGSHSVLILPLLSKSAAELAMVQPNGVSSEAAACVCVGVLAAVAGLNRKGWCHADIKPANIMLAGNEKSVVLVDLGSCTRIGEEIKECTEVYALGLPRVAGLPWDLACLASTLCVLSGHSYLLGSTVADVKEGLAGLQDDVCCRLATCILEHIRNTSSADELGRVWEDVMGIVRGNLGEETASRLAAAWPSPL